MRQFSDLVSTDVRLTDAYYTEGALRRSPRFEEQLDALVAVDDDLLDAQHALDKVRRRPLAAAMAARDVVGAEMAEAVREVRFDLAGTSRTAAKETPYNEVFREGVERFAEATIPEREGEVKILIGRLETHLAANHPVRVKGVPILRRHLEDWQAAIADLRAVEVEIDLATGDLDAARRAHETVRVQIYGYLVMVLGKVRANRFFPKASGKTPAAGPKTPAAKTSSKAASSTVEPPPTTRRRRQRSGKSPFDPRFGVDWRTRTPPTEVTERASVAGREPAVDAEVGDDLGGRAEGPGAEEHVDEATKDGRPT